MRKPAMLTVLFYLRLNKKAKSNDATVYCRISLGGVRGVPFSTNVKVSPGKWKNQKTDDQAKNDRLKRIRNGIETLKDKMDIEGEIYTVHDLVATYSGKRDYNASLLNVYQDYINDKIDSGRAQSTIVAITNYRKVLETYINQKKKGLLVKQVDTAFFQAYKKWLKQEGFAKNTMAKHLIYFKSVVDFAVILQLIKYNPIKPIKIERDKPKEPDYLTIQELDLIINADFEADPAIRPIAKRLDRIRDILIILTCTGVHWADYLLLDESNLYIDQEGDLIYCANRQKTDNTAMNVINVPLAKKIIEKYGGSSKLPKMSNQKFNDYIKVLFAHLKINKYGSAKIGRKSLADYHTNEDPKPDGVIMKMMGLGDARSLDHSAGLIKGPLKSF